MAQVVYSIGRAILKRSAPFWGNDYANGDADDNLPEFMSLVFCPVENGGISGERN